MFCSRRTAAASTWLSSLDYNWARCLLPVNTSGILHYSMEEEVTSRIQLKLLGSPLVAWVGPPSIHLLGEHLHTNLSQESSLVYLVISASLFAVGHSQVARFGQDFTRQAIFTLWRGEWFARWLPVRMTLYHYISIALSITCCTYLAQTHPVGTPVGVVTCDAPVELISWWWGSRARHWAVVCLVITNCLFPADHWLVGSAASAHLHNIQLPSGQSSLIGG